MTMTMYEGCRYNGGVGNKNAAVAVVYARADPTQGFFPHKQYLTDLCKALAMNENDFYVTPVSKDNLGSEKPMHVYVEGLINELAMLKPKMVWILGQEPLLMMNNNDVLKYYKHTYGMYFPFLLHNFFGLLVAAEKEVATMPETMARLFYGRMQRAAAELVESKKQVAFKPARERRGDLHMLDLMQENTPLHEDSKMADEYSFTIIWSDVVHDHIILVNSTKAKKEAKKLGFGLVFLKEEIKNLDRESADTLTKYMKMLRTREVSLQK